MIEKRDRIAHYKGIGVTEADHKFYVYLLYRDIERTDPFYVGKGHGDRINYHERLLEKGKRINRHKNNTIRMCLARHGFVPKDVFAEQLSEADSFQLERALILWWGRRDKNSGCLTNMTDGGEGTAGCLYSAEQRAANSAARKGKPGPVKSIETRKRISASLLGKPKSKAHRESLRRANLGKVQSPEARAKNSASNLGRHVSENTRQKLSAALTGRMKTAEHCRNISAAKRGKTQSREVIERQVSSRAATMAGKPGPNLGRKFSAIVKENMLIRLTHTATKGREL